MKCIDLKEVLYGARFSIVFLWVTANEYHPDTSASFVILRFVFIAYLWIMTDTLQLIVCILAIGKNNIL